jgi:hypothetical protein
MHGYLVFVRFFLGYSKSFPFERFLHLDDADIDGAVEALRREWRSDGANAARLRASRRELERRAREWKESGLARPGRSMGWGVPGSAARPEDADPTPEEAREPSFEEVAAEAGWGHPTALGDSRYGITHRYPLRGYATEEAARDAVAALQGRVSELARSAHLTEQSDGEVYLLAAANPRFIIVAEEKLSRAELIRARERIHRVNSQGGGQQSPEEALLRVFLPNIRSTMEQIDALATPEDVAGALGDSRVMASAASKTTSADAAERRDTVEPEPPCYDQRLRCVHPQAAETLAEAHARKLTEALAPILRAASQRTASTADRAEGERAEGASPSRRAEKCRGGKHKRRRGRPRGSKTAAAYTRLYLDWKAAHNGTGITKAEFIRERGLRPTAIHAIERGRANVRRAAASGRKRRDEPSQADSK